MNNYEFIQIADQIRDTCDEMSTQQIQDLVALLEYDIDVRLANE